MNERIQELAEQAGLKWKAQPPHYSNTNNPIDFPVSANRDLEKFAELIVKEMLQTCEDHPAWTGRMIGEQIKKHFGVEE